MNIALPSITSKEGMYGINVREILEKSVSKLNGQEMEYDKEMINKYLATMLQGECFISMFIGKDLTG